MKTIICLLCAFSSCWNVSAQMQEMEQLRLDLEKLAQFKLMLSQAKSGYQNLTNGYNGIINSGKSNFNLHQGYLDGLLKVNPAIKNDPVVQRVVKSAYQIASDCRALALLVTSSGNLSSDEIKELSRSIADIGEAVSANNELMNAVLQERKLRMSDADRTQVLQNIDRYLNKQSSKLKALQEQYQQVLTIRQQNRRDVNAIKRLANLH
jgi:hypothetical protein